jgi:DNA-directed RNA polymerase I, II, and III subunit RPABC5
MSCGNVIADKWMYYKTEVAKLHGRPFEAVRVTLDSGEILETIEKTIMDKLQLKRPCCRKHFLSHVDLD